MIALMAAGHFGRGGQLGVRAYHKLKDKDKDMVELMKLRKELD